MLIKFILVYLTIVTSVHCQQLVGGEFMLDEASRQSVQKSVQSLGDEVIKSNYKFAIDKMYPRWKKRQALRFGDESQLLEEYNSAGVKLQKAGITLNTFEAEPALKAFKVHPKVAAKANKDQLENTFNYEILVFVPTKMKMTIRLKDALEMKVMRQSFQIAVKNENANQWSFIDGATITVRDLRSLFPLLPHSLVLPQKVDTEIK